MLKGRTPLGWLQLVHNKARFAVAVSGVGFAVILVFMQLGFMNMLFDATTTLHRQFDAQIVILSKGEARQMTQTGTVSRRRLLQALGVPGVAEGAPLYTGMLDWTRPSDGSKGQIFVMAIDPDFNAFFSDDVSAYGLRLHEAGTFLFDSGSRGDFEAFINAISSPEPPSAQISSTRLTAIGTFEFGASFAIEAEAITSAETFFSINPDRDPGVMNVGLLRVLPGENLDEVVGRINSIVESDAQAMSMQDFMALTRAFLVRESPIAYIFSFGVAVGLFVGAIIVVQILSSDVQEHLSEYATFKAMGFTNRYLLGIVYEQSLVLTTIGFFPALLISMVLYYVIGGAVSMPMTMPLERVLLVLCLTAVMCGVAGTLALRRIYTADPAEVF